MSEPFIPPPGAPARATDQLHRLAIELDTALAEKEALETKLEQVDKKIRHLQFALLPKELTELGLTSVTTADGVTFEISRLVRGSIKDMDRVKEILRETNNETLMKISAAVELNDDAAKQRFLELIQSAEGISITAAKEAIHPKTLDKFLREILEQEAQGKVALPPDFRKAFGVFESDFVKHKK